MQPELLSLSGMVPYVQMRKSHTISADPSVKFCEYRRFLPDFSSTSKKNIKKTFDFTAKAY